MTEIQIDISDTINQDGQMDGLVANVTIPVENQDWPDTKKFWAANIEDLLRKISNYLNILEDLETK